MKRLILFLATLCALLPAHAEDYTRHVNPLMGTQSSFELSAGNTYPAIGMPWGMNTWTPRTNRMGDGWQYTYTAHRIYGFEQTHQPSPWMNDYGQFSLMPVTGRVEMDEEKRACWFSHKAEVAQPHYYKVYLADYDVTTEVAPTERAAMFRFTFPEAESFVVVDAYDRGSHIRIIPEENKIIGYTTRNSGGVPDNFRCHFVVVFDKPFTYQATFSNDEQPAKADATVPVSLKEGKLEQTNFHTGAVVGFRTKKGETIHASVASSFISPEQAERNLKELGDAPFNTLVEQGRAKWNDALGRIELEGGTPQQRNTFYSCLYRSLLFPRRFWEVDGQGNPIHYSPYNGQVMPGYMYTDTGFWDTFRCLFPLLNLMYPSENLKMQEGLLNAYRESGFFPEWASPGHRGCMVGNNSASVLADAYLKGICVDDFETLYEGLLHGTENVHPTVSSTGRLGHEHYNRLGYVPCDVGIHENAARTLEYAYNDWCIMQLARELNRPEEEIGRFAQRAMNYKNLFHPDFKLMCGKKQDGTFEEDFSPLKWGGNFTEGNSWHYTWSVFHDPQGLIDLMGGNDCFVQMLDSVFSVPPAFDDSYYGFPIHEIREMTVMDMGNYAHGNQPIQHMIYLYNYAAQPWKAQQRLREVMDRMYTPTPDGYCGDEDNGQTSAWYVFSALGFYPVCPGSGQYVLGAPLFNKATLHLENGRKVVINAPGNCDRNIYIDALKLNGQPYTKNYYRHADLMEGADIEVKMAPAPNTRRGTLEEDLPYSFSRENKTKISNSPHPRNPWRNKQKDIMKELKIKKLPAAAVEASTVAALLDAHQVSFQPIGNVNWPEYPYQPEVKFRIAHTGDAILLHYQVTEASVRAVAPADDGRVWEDACVEFFLSPDADDFYYNFECNCATRLLLHGGPAGGERPGAPEEVLASISRWSSLGSTPFDERIGECTWEVALVIPVTALFRHRIASLDGRSMRANFYKCGDLLQTPHFLSWSPIDLPQPKFHCPEFFGTLRFE